MSSSKDYEFEYYERYFGSPGNVKKIMEDCPCCGSKMVISHQSDNGTLLLHETSRCSECDYGGRKLIHVIN